jgi:hypothetical protein
MIATSATISAMETTSSESSDRAAVRIWREAISPMIAQPTSASGSHGASGQMPVESRNAREKTAKADMETAGNTR